jgi:hypothetical protein
MWMWQTKRPVATLMWMWQTKGPIDAYNVDVANERSYCHTRQQKCGKRKVPLPLKVFVDKLIC